MVALVAQAERHWQGGVANNVLWLRPGSSSVLCLCARVGCEEGIELRSKPPPHNPEIWTKQARSNHSRLPICARAPGVIPLSALSLLAQVLSSTSWTVSAGDGAESGKTRIQ